MSTLSRWPLLLAALALVAAAIGMDLGSEGGTAVAAALLLLGAVCLGAFLYAEGARRREWWAQHDRDQVD